MLPRRALLLGFATALVSCASTPRTLPLAVAVGQKGMDAAVELDALLQAVSEYVGHFQRASCTYEIVSQCRPQTAATLTSLPPACRPDGGRQEAQDDYRQTITDLRTLVGRLRGGYAAYFDLASFDAGGATNTAFAGIVEAAQKFPVAGENLGQLLTGAGAIFSALVRDNQARKLHELNTFYAGIYSHMNTWWRETFRPEVIAPILRDVSRFNFAALPTQCFAPPALSDAIPFREENIRSALRQAGYPGGLSTEIAAIATRLGKVEQGFQVLEAAHRTLAADRASPGETLTTIDDWLRIAKVGA